jgi:hypothetical protein
MSRPQTPSIMPDLAREVCAMIARRYVLRVPILGEPDFIQTEGAQPFPAEEMPKVDREYVDYMAKLGFLRKLTEEQNGRFLGWRQIGVDGTDCELYCLRM